jgi:DNA-binding MarR family transcriptional regulator
MDEKDAITERVFRLVNIANASEKKPRDFGIGHVLFRAEIHTIEAIVNHPDCNASDLALRLGITNGALTQIIAKLRDKGLVDQYNFPDNRKEIYFRLTGEGLLAQKGHALFHARMNKTIGNYLDSLDPSARAEIGVFLDLLIANWPQ